MASEDPMAFQFESSLQGEEKIDDEEEYGMARYMSGLSIETNFFQGDDDDDTQLIPASDEYSEQNELCLCGNYPFPPVVIKEYYYASTDDEGKKGSVLMREEEEEETNTDTWRRSNYCSSSSSTSPGRRMRKENYKKKKKKEEEVITSTTTTTSIGFDHQHQHHLELEIVPSSLYNSPFDLETSSSGTTSPNWRISSPGDDPRDVKARLKMWAQAVAASASKYATTSLHLTSLY